MKIFLAWSGEASRRAALALRDWLPLVLQRAKPFMSEDDVRKGVRWRQEISKQLASVRFAILCLTRDNLHSRWIHFEAGAVAHHAAHNRVTALLLGIRHSDIGDPIREFQQTKSSREDLYRLVKELNAAFERDALDDSRLEETFAAFWPKLERRLTDALSVIDEAVEHE